MILRFAATLAVSLVLLTPLPLAAAAHSDAWCADAVDFAMRTVERREEGKTQEAIALSIRQSPYVFEQQFPELGVEDMQDLVIKVYRNRWTRFGAAKATTRVCVDERRTAGARSWTLIQSVRS